MKSPVTGIEVRWRLDGETSWQSRTYPPSSSVEIPDAIRGGDYSIEARTLGVNELASVWVPVTITMPTTNREGTAALPVNSFGNRASTWDGDTSVTFSATDSSATISMTAGTFIVGETHISYGPSSAVVSGAPETSKTVYLYYDDPQLQGGSRTLGVTESIVESMSGYGRIAIGSLKINFPAVGAPPSTGGGGIGGGGGGGGAGGNPIENPV